MATIDIHTAVRDRYGAIARAGNAKGCCEPSMSGALTGRDAESCCGTPESASTGLGYSVEELAALPPGADLGLGCGNPIREAGLKPGETVLDLGSGAGIDCLLAARTVGPGGRAIGVDMTHDMLTKARANAAAVQAGNVEFRLGEIEHLPLADASVDCVISNCVVNLSPEKGQVFRECFRVLRPGGRMVISDVVANRPLPADMRANNGLVCGCIGNAATIAEVQGWLAAAGFTDIAIEPKPGSRQFIATWSPGSGAEDWVVSAIIRATRPAVACCGAAAVR